MTDTLKLFNYFNDQLILFTPDTNVKLILYKLEFELEMLLIKSYICAISC